MIFLNFSTKCIFQETEQLSIINTSDAPSAVGAYSQAVRTGDLLFISGQVGLDTSTNALVPDGVVEETQQALKNINSICTAAGISKFKIVKTTILLADIEDYQSVNNVYKAFWEGSSPPARACYAVKDLPIGAKVEIEAIASIE